MTTPATDRESVFAALVDELGFTIDESAQAGDKVRYPDGQARYVNPENDIVALYRKLVSTEQARRVLEAKLNCACEICNTPASEHFCWQSEVYDDKFTPEEPPCPRT